MKRVVMFQGLFANEKEWAKNISHFGRVTLIQQGFGIVEHTEWEAGDCVFSAPKKRPAIRFSRLDEATFGLVLSVATLKDYWPMMQGQKSDVIIANANSWALTALFLKAIGKTRKVVCLIGDYFPTQSQKLSVRIYRRIANLFTRWVAKYADEVWSLSPRIPTASVNPQNFVVPIHVESINSPADSRTEIGYIGIPSPDHALDILFAICRKHNIKLNVIGESAYLNSIKSLAPPTTVFHGKMSDYGKISQILSKCFCGYAVYRNTGPHNYSYYGFPSKTLRFFASNTPVITTNTAHFSQTIETFGIGHVVEPELEQIEKAILDIKTRPAEFYEAISRFRETWNKDVEKFCNDRLAVLLKD